MIGPMSRRALAGMAILAVAACASFREGDEAEPVPTAPDAATADDATATTDVGIPTDAAACGHTFCADFENGSFTDGFSEAKNEDAIKLLTVDAMPRSKFALRTSLPPATYSNRYRYLRNIFIGSGVKTATLSFAVRVVKAPALAEGNVQVATIGWGRDAVVHDKYSEMQVRLGATWLEAKRDEEDVDEYQQQVPFAPGWNQVVVQLTFSAANTVTAFATVDNTPLFGKTFTSGESSADIDIGIGSAGVDAQLAAEVSYDIDDVTVDIMK
jgi:hypothetical protein